LISPVQVRLTQSPDETAKFIQDLTVAIMEAPYRPEAEFHNFCSISTKKSGKRNRPTGRSQLQTQDLSSWNAKTHEKFCDMLLQITGIGFPVAIAVVRKFQTPGALLQAYSIPSLNQKAKESMLENEPCYAIRGSTSRSQRIGPKRSRQIFRFFWAEEKDLDTLMTDL
jgi:ERCC4-type nuclease